MVQRSSDECRNDVECGGRGIDSGWHEIFSEGTIAYCALSKLHNYCSYIVAQWTVVFTNKITNYFQIFSYHESNQHCLPF